MLKTHPNHCPHPHLWPDITKTNALLYLTLLWIAAACKYARIPPYHLTYETFHFKYFRFKYWMCKMFFLVEVNIAIVIFTIFKRLTVVFVEQLLCGFNKIVNPNPCLRLFCGIYLNIRRPNDYREIKSENQRVQRT